MKMPSALLWPLIVVLLLSNGCREKSPKNSAAGETGTRPVLAISPEGSATLALGAALAAENNWLLDPCATDSEAALSVVRGTGDLALIRADRLYMILSSGGETAAALRNGCRSLGGVALTPIMILADGTASPSGLRQGRINTGSLGSPDSAAGIKLLAGLGLTAHADYNPEGLEFTDALDALKSGKLDALIWIAGDRPLPAGTARRYPPLPLPAGDDPFYRANPWLCPLTLRTYINPRLPEVPVVSSAGIPWILLCRTETDTVEAYKLTRKLIRNQPEAGWYPPLFPIDRSTAGRLTVIPHHPGTARYFTLSQGTLE